MIAVPFLASTSFFYILVPTGTFSTIVAEIENEANPETASDIILRLKLCLSILIWDNDFRLMKFQHR